MEHFILCFKTLKSSLTSCLCPQGRWGRGGGSVTGRLAAWTAARWCAAAEATTRRGSAGPPSASASSTGAAPCTAATATSRSTCTPARARRDLAAAAHSTPAVTLGHHVKTTALVPSCRCRDHQKDIDSTLGAERCSSQSSPVVQTVGRPLKFQSSWRSCLFHCSR